MSPAKFTVPLAIILTIIAGFLILFAGANGDTRKCADADAVDYNANRQLNGKLLALTNNSTFFSIFSVALDKKCPFWADDMKCSIRECSVCNCAENEIPPAWRRPPPSASREPCPSKAAANKLNFVDRSLPDFLEKCKRRQWERSAQEFVWTVQDRKQDTQFVDLRKNPEQDTGYTGRHANSVWDAIYNENCFALAKTCKNGACGEDSCKEERVLYRLLSGVHTSITAHVAKRCLLSNGEWGENPLIYKYRIANDPERVKNLNVAFALVARAVAKASSKLHPDVYKYITGDDENDKFTETALKSALQSPLLDPNCQKPTFDESDMFVESTRHRLPEFRAKFRNISKIMDCVGCEKCRLWGKLQFLGLGTALRILFDDTVPNLQHNEVIALINFLHKLSSSVLWVDKMETQQRNTGSTKFVVSVLTAIGLAIVVVRNIILASKNATEQAAPHERDELRQPESKIDTKNISNGEKKKSVSRTTRKRARHVSVSQENTN